MPQARPIVSVLLPVRDGAEHLEECLASLKAQTLEEFEIVAVDDGSMDATGEILAAWHREDDRLRVIPNQAPGLIAALNLGLEQCRSNLVARIDADDRAHPDRLLRQVELLRADPGLTVAGCLVEHFAEQEVGRGLRIYERWLNSLLTHEEILRERFIESPIPHPGAMFRRTAIVAAGGYRDLGWPEDYDLWLRLAASAHRFGKVREVLHFWRDRSLRMTRTDPRYSVERFLECKAEHLVLGPLEKCRELLVWGSGQTGRRLTKHLVRRGAPLAAFIDIDPAKIGRTVRGVEVLAPLALERFAARRGDGLIILAAVSSRGARAKIRTALDAGGWRETIDYWCAA
ncbi:MAG: glycosyltransferase [Thermoanaerobaculia bacterium]